MKTQLPVPLFFTWSRNRLPSHNVIYQITVWWTQAVSISSVGLVTLVSRCHSFITLTLGKKRKAHRIKHSLMVSVSINKWASHIQWTSSRWHYVSDHRGLPAHQVLSDYPIKCITHAEGSKIWPHLILLPPPPLILGTWIVFYFIPVKSENNARCLPSGAQHILKLAKLQNYTPKRIFWGATNLKNTLTLTALA